MKFHLSALGPEEAGAGGLEVLVERVGGGAVELLFWRRAGM